MKAWVLCLSVLLGGLPKPELHIYTVDGKPEPGWVMRDFNIHFHKSKLLRPDMQDHPIVLHYAVGDMWSYDTEHLSKRSFRKAYRKANNIKGEGQKTLIWIHAEGCGPCKRMEPFLPELKKLTEVEEVDWDWETPGEFNIKAVPLTIILDADGNELKRWTGYVTLQEIKDNL